MKITNKLINMFLDGLFPEHEEEFDVVKVQIPGHPGVRVEKISNDTVKLVPCLFDSKGDILLEGDETEYSILQEGRTLQVTNWIVYQTVEIR